MAKILTMATTKGGTGKTTLTASLATYWQKKGLNVAAIDADPNTNLSRWLAKGEIKNIEIRAESDENVIIDAIYALAENCDIVLVDIAGFGNQSMVYAIGVSSLVIVPSRPAEDDVLEALRTRQIVQNASKLTRRDIPYRVVLTQVKQGTIVLEHSRKQFHAFDVPLFDTEIVSRTAFQTARFQGTTPIFFEPDGKAAEEIALLARETERLIGLDLKA